MRSLTAVDIVTIWDQGQSYHVVDKAMLLLVFALPEMSMDELLALTLGQRNGRLLQLRQLTLGNQIEGLVTCPQCGETLEFNVYINQLLQPETTEAVQEILIDDWQIRFSLPTSTDLAAILNSSNIPMARQQLIDRCLLSANQDETSKNGKDLPSAVLAQVAEAIAEADPLAEMRFRLSCHACQHEWRAQFDIVSFFWTELAAQAKRLLLEVHQLAHAYGWRESEILAMSSQRRHTYLEFVHA